MYKFINPIGNSLLDINNLYNFKSMNSDLISKSISLKQLIYY